LPPVLLIPPEPLPPDDEPPDAELPPLLVVPAEAVDPPLPPLPPLPPFALEPPELPPVCDSPPVPEPPWPPVCPGCELPPSEQPASTSIVTMDIDVRLDFIETTPWDVAQPLTNAQNDWQFEGDENSVLYRSESAHLGFRS
jgi:hypothetical protein